MKLVSTFLKIIGRGEVNKAAASEVDKKDPDSEELEKILAKNEIKTPKTFRVYD